MNIIAVKKMQIRPLCAHTKENSSQVCFSVFCFTAGYKYKRSLLTAVASEYLIYFFGNRHLFAVQHRVACPAVLRDHTFVRQQFY